MATVTGPIYRLNGSSTLLGTYTAETGIWYSVQDLLDSASVTMPSDTIMALVYGSYVNDLEIFSDQVALKNVEPFSQYETGSYSRRIYLVNPDDNIAVFYVTCYVNNKTAFSGRNFTWFKGDRFEISEYLSEVNTPQLITDRTFDHAIANGTTYTSLSNSIRCTNGLHVHVYYTGNDITVTPYIFTNGAWVQVTPYIFNNGAWGEVTPKINYRGTWLPPT